jgi:Flp pilus assembly secretin CpaC
MAEPSTLGRRIEHIIGEQRDRRPPARRTAVVAALFAGLVFVGLASCRVREVDAKPAQAKPVNQNPKDDGDPFAAAPSQDDDANLRGAEAQTKAHPATTVQVAIESWFVKIDQSNFEFNDLGKYGTTIPASPSAGTGATNESHWVGRLDVPAVLRDLAQKPGYEMLSKPSITVLSGMYTDMIVAKELRYPQSYSEAGAPEEFTTRNVGIELKAKPTVAMDGHTIDMNLNPRITEFDGFVLYGEKNVQPVFSTQEMTTEVSMQDGATVVMGGLALVEKTNTSEVPKLGGIASLISGNSDDAKKRMLLIFLTARVVRQGEASKK